MTNENYRLFLPDKHETGIITQIFRKNKGEATGYLAFLGKNLYSLCLNSILVKKNVFHYFSEVERSY